MRGLLIIAGVVLVSGCGSIPLPAGWVSQDTVQQKNLDDLAGKIIEKITPPEPVNLCDSIREPGKFARPGEISNYYIAMAGCLAGAEPPPPSGLVGALSNIEKSRREILRGSNDRTRLIAESLLGVARLGVDLEIAKKDRESRERIADAENSGDDSPGIQVGGDYIIGNENANQSTDSHDDNRVTTTTETTTSETTTSDSNDDNRATTTTETTTSETTTSDSNDDNRATTTTETTTSETTTSDSNDDNRVDNRVTNNAAPADDDEGGGDDPPVISDLHARCIYDSETEQDRLDCNRTYQNSERRVVYQKCESNGWTRDSEQCLSEIADRDEWARKMGLEWNDEKMTYQLIGTPAPAGPGAGS